MSCLRRRRRGSPILPAPEVPGRFWDESVHLPTLFEMYRARHDSANAAACFDRLAQHRFHEMAGRPDYEPAKQSIISVFQAKSGGTFLHNRLLQWGYQEFAWSFTDVRCLSVCYAGPDALNLFLRGGCAHHSHARPDPNLLAALDRAGVDKIWLHLRNPAEACVSSYHHFLGDLGDQGECAEQRRLAAATEAQRLGINVAQAKSDFVVEQIGWHVAWVAPWLQFAEEHPGLVECTYFPELADAHAMLSRVFGKLGAELPCAELAVAGPQDRYRRKTSQDWRDGLSREAQDVLESRVRDGLREFAAFERLWS